MRVSLVRAVAVVVATSALWACSSDSTRQLRLALVDVREGRKLVLFVGCPDRISEPRVEESGSQVIVSIRGTPTDNKCFAVRCVTLSAPLGERSLRDGTGSPIAGATLASGPADPCG